MSRVVRIGMLVSAIALPAIVAACDPNHNRVTGPTPLTVLTVSAVVPNTAAKAVSAQVSVLGAHVFRYYVYGIEEIAKSAVVVVH